MRPGGLGTPKRGIGRLALESGAPVVPLAVIGTERVRRGWRIRPHRVTVRAGRALTFPHGRRARAAQLAQAVTDRIWPCVALQWEWLGGLAPLRHATVIGAGAWGTSLAVTLKRAGLDVQLAARTREQADRIRSEGENVYLPGVALDGIDVVRSARPTSPTPTSSSSPSRPRAAARARRARRADPARGRPRRAEQGPRPAARQRSRRLRRRARPGPRRRLPRRPAHAADCLAGARSSPPAATARSPRSSSRCSAAGLDARSNDVTGVELAGIAKNAAVLAAAAARPPARTPREPPPGRCSPSSRPTR